jgi:regulator of protease activity HflC (stomatin/prohibitin superfamily)
MVGHFCSSPFIFNLPLMKKITLVKAMGILVLAFSLPQCATIVPGEVGFKQTLGKIVGKPIQMGTLWYNPFTSHIVHVSIKKTEVPFDLVVSSSEGSLIGVKINLTYHVKADSALSVYTKLGLAYQESIVSKKFRTCLRETSEKYRPAEFYNSERSKIETQVSETMTDRISKYGFVVDTVELKEIDLAPASKRISTD